MKCFWNTWAAPPAPIVVTAPQYSHTTRASPSPGLSGPPHELHFMLCGIGGGGNLQLGGVLFLIETPAIVPGEPRSLGRESKALGIPRRPDCDGVLNNWLPPPNLEIRHRYT